MRVETHPYDRVRVTVYYAINGVPETGLSPTVRILRNSDSQWLNGANNWVGAAVDLAMVEVDSVDLPGLYEFDLPAPAVARAAGADGYYALIEKNADNDVEPLLIQIADPANDVLTDDLQPTPAWPTGSIGEALLRTLALRQQNTKVVYTAWAANNEPTAGTVYIYPDKATADADSPTTGTGAIGSYTFAAAYDGSLRITDYSSTRVS